MEIKIVKCDKVNKYQRKVIDKIPRYGLTSNQDVYNVISNNKYIEKEEKNEGHLY